MKKNYKYFLKIMLLSLFIVPLSIPNIVGAKKIEPSVIFDGVGNEKIKSCPDFDCDVVKYGAIMPSVELLESSGEWYKVNYTERGYYDNDLGRSNKLPKSEWQTVTGWMYYTLIPKDIFLEIGGESEIISDKLLGTAVLKNKSNTYNCPSVSCTFIDSIEGGTVLQVIKIDKERGWYKIKFTDPVLNDDWDKWIKISNFENKPFGKIEEPHKDETVSIPVTTTSLVESKGNGVSGWFKKFWNSFLSIF